MCKKIFFRKIRTQCLKDALRSGTPVQALRGFNFGYTTAGIKNVSKFRIYNARSMCCVRLYGRIVRFSVQNDVAAPPHDAMPRMQCIHIGCNDGALCFLIIHTHQNITFHNVPGARSLPYHLGYVTHAFSCLNVRVLYVALRRSSSTQHNAQRIHAILAGHCVVCTVHLPAARKNDIKTTDKQSKDHSSHYYHPMGLSLPLDSLAAPLHCRNAPHPSRRWMQLLRSRRRAAW